MVVAVKDEKGKVKLRQDGSLLTADDAVFAGFCGSLTALIFADSLPCRWIRSIEQGLYFFLDQIRHQTSVGFLERYRVF